MTVPIIDGIDHETFAYRSVYQDHQHFRGIFEWGMLYKVRLKSAKHKNIRLSAHPPNLHDMPASRKPSCLRRKLQNVSTEASRIRAPPTLAGFLPSTETTSFPLVPTILVSIFHLLANFQDVFYWQLNDLLVMSLVLYNLQ